MGNFFARLRNAMARFMYGRNGADQLSMAMLLVYVMTMLLESLVMIFFPYEIIASVFSLLLAVQGVLLCWRIFSRNLSKRRAENARFLAWWTPRQNTLIAARNRRKDKEHRYFRCPTCGAYCRVPRGKGKIQITCPRCRSTITGKS